MAKNLNLDMSHSKTYASLKTMERSIANAEWLGEKARYIVMPVGDRFTPVFMASSLPEGCGIMWCAQNGWHVVG